MTVWTYQPNKPQPNQTKLISHRPTLTTQTISPPPQVQGLTGGTPDPTNPPKKSRSCRDQNQQISVCMAGYLPKFWLESDGPLKNSRFSDSPPRTPKFWRFCRPLSLKLFILSLVGCLVGLVAYEPSRLCLELLHGEHMASRSTSTISIAKCARLRRAKRRLKS